MELSDRKFIELVQRAYPEVVEKPILTQDQLMLHWRVMKAIETDPAIITHKSVRHNLGRVKLAWVESLVGATQQKETPE